MQHERVPPLSPSAASPTPSPTAPSPFPGSQEEDSEEEELAADVISWSREDAQPSSWLPDDDEDGADGDEALDSDSTVTNRSRAVSGGDARHTLSASGAEGSTAGGGRSVRSRVAASLTAERMLQLTRMRNSVDARRSNRTLILH
jgi:hypothetical protein